MDKKIKDVCEQIIELVNDDVEINGLCGACQSSGNAEALTLADADDIKEIILENSDVILKYINNENKRIDETVNNERD